MQTIIIIISVYYDRLYHCLFRFVVSLTQLILGLELSLYHKYNTQLL